MILADVAVGGMSVGLVVSVVVALIAIFAPIIGVYVILIKFMGSTSKSLADILLAVNTHIQDTTKHPSTEKVVYNDVCHAIQEKHEVIVKSIDYKIKCVDTKLDKLSDGVSEIVKALL
jgi:hypothetical protein